MNLIVNLMGGRSEPELNLQSFYAKILFYKMLKSFKLSTITVLYFINLNCNLNEPTMIGMENEVTLNYPDRNTKVYLKSKVWGIADNHEMTRISVFKSKQADSSEMQIFHTATIYYYKKNDSSLLVYAPASSFSNSLGKIGNVNLRIVPINNADTLKSLARTYQSRGLSRLSAYDTKID